MKLRIIVFLCTVVLFITAFPMNYLNAQGHIDLLHQPQYQWIGHGYRVEGGVAQYFSLFYLFIRFLS